MCCALTRKYIDATFLPNWSNFFVPYYIAVEQLHHSQANKAYMSLKELQSYQMGCGSNIVMLKKYKKEPHTMHTRFHKIQSDVLHPDWLPVKDLWPLYGGG